LLDDAQDLLGEIARPIRPEEADSIHLALAEIASIHADLLVEADRSEEAKTQWKSVLELLPTPELPRARSLSAEAHLGLARLATDPDLAVDHLMIATRLWRGRIVRTVTGLASAVEMLQKVEDAGAKSVMFALAAFGRQKGSRIVASAVGSASDALEFAHILEQLIDAMDPKAPKYREALGWIAENVEQQLHRFGRVTARPSEHKGATVKLIAAYASLCETLAASGAPDAAISAIRNRIDQMRRQQRRSST
jgi:tetratricopeptide (TPR) repeat protein